MSHASLETSTLTFLTVDSPLDAMNHANMQFNEIPTSSYEMQQRDGGMISQGIGRAIIQTLEPIVLSQVSMR